MLHQPRTPHGYRAESSTRSGKALAPEILTWPAGNPQLIGGQCGDCGATTFPAQPRCPRCSAGQTGELLLPRRGMVVAWTKYGIGIAVGLDSTLAAPSLTTPRAEDASPTVPPRSTDRFRSTPTSG
ncbi:hypothetical protein MHAE_05652 [Mycobacterium haemophilum DSM 44634]|nr:hypothetical protein [Mycobacterium haemophilum DSM 44634]